MLSFFHCSTEQGYNRSMKTNFTYLSADLITHIHAIEWSVKKPIAIVQIAHGMMDYANRYDRFAKFLNEHQIVVVANDHLGHGQSVRSFDELGYFGEDGNEHVLRDMYTLFTQTKEKYPDIPYFFMGHSMGSFLTRQFIERYGDQFGWHHFNGNRSTTPSLNQTVQALL